MIFTWVSPRASYLPGEDPGGKERFTINDYRDSLFSKFNLNSRMELVLFALKYKLVEVE